MTNLFAGIPAELFDELTQTLLATSRIRIERIVSHGQASLPGAWYDQDRPEWVLLVKGAARLQFDGQRPLDLRPGDFVNIPAHKRHRVEWTDPTQPTIWLAIHYEDDTERAAR